MSWDIPSDQPMHLHILYSLQKILGDPDVALFPYLLEGAPTGFDGPIQPSNCFPLSQPDESAESPLLSVHHCNWSSAEDHPDEVRALIDEEVKNGWVTPFHGSLSDAQEQWPLGVAVGKLGLVLAEGRNPRLVVDNTVCGVNARCVMPEKATLPTASITQRIARLHFFITTILLRCVPVRSGFLRSLLEQAGRFFPEVISFTDMAGPCWISIRG